MTTSKPDYWTWLKAFNGDLTTVGPSGLALVVATCAFGLGAGFRLLKVIAELAGGLTLPKAAFAVPSILVGAVFFLSAGYIYYRLHWALAIPLSGLIVWFFGTLFVADISSMW